MKKNFIFPENCLYYSTFVWVEDRGRGIFRIGLTDYGQHVLDDIISITLPEKGIYVEKDEEIISIDSIEDTYTIHSPIAGPIDELNMEVHVRYYKRLSSTNDKLSELIGSEDLPEGTVIQAGYQFHGKGHAGSTWHSESGKNLGGPYKSRAAAERRLRQVEYFKRKR